MALNLLFSQKKEHVSLSLSAAQCQQVSGDSPSSLLASLPGRPMSIR